MTPNVYTYWEGPQPGWIDLCLRTIRQNIPAVHVLDPDSWKDWITTPDIIPRAEQLAPNLKSDYLRAHLLHHHGGIWIDADAIVFRDVRPIWKRLDKWEFVAYRVGPPAPQLCSAFIASRPGGEISGRYLAIMENRMRNRPQLRRLALGPRVLWAAARQTKGTIYKIPTDRVHPIHWLRRSELWIERSDEDHAKQYPGHPHAYCCMLTHRALGPLRGQSPDSILSGSSLASWLYRCALQSHPG